MKLVKLVALGLLSAALFATSASADYVRFTSGILCKTGGTSYYQESPSFVPKLCWVGSDGFAVQNPATGVQYFCAPFGMISCTNSPLGAAGVKQILASMLWCIQNNKTVSLCCTGADGATVIWDQFSIVN